MTAPAVWVDGDSCPVPVREILLRWSERGRIALQFFSNRELPLPKNAEQTVVDGTSVDDHIVSQLNEVTREVILITRDIPLAERCLEFPHCTVLNDRGTVFSPEMIGERRSVRDVNARIREMGLESMERKKRFGPRERKMFADALDRVLSSLPKDRTFREVNR